MITQHQRSTLAAAVCFIGDLADLPAFGRGRRCRMHGGTNPGAPFGNQNAYRHGRYSAENVALRRLARRLLEETGDLINKLK
jgi:hypothetical protein